MVEIRINHAATATGRSIATSNVQSEQGTQRLGRNVRLLKALTKGRQVLLDPTTDIAVAIYQEAGVIEETVRSRHSAPI